MDLLERLKCNNTMENKSIIRKIDELGRIVIPYEFRRDVLKNETTVFVNVVENFIILRKDSNDHYLLKTTLDEIGRIIINKEIREQVKL